jgi:hypothetical protein
MTTLYCAAVLNDLTRSVTFDNLDVCNGFVQRMRAEGFHVRVSTLEDPPGCSSDATVYNTKGCDL